MKGNHRQVLLSDTEALGQRPPFQTQTHLKRRCTTISLTLWINPYRQVPLVWIGHKETSHLSIMHTFSFFHYVNTSWVSITDTFMPPYPSPQSLNAPCLRGRWASSIPAFLEAEKRPTKANVWQHFTSRLDVWMPKTKRPLWRDLRDVEFTHR